MSEKRRDQSIDILKCLAALMITNSHMRLLYGDYSILATGGAIGDVLFFFCSGYTLFLGKGDTFDNWYKRRINRIYPTVFAWALVAAVVFGKEMNMYEILVSGGGWFVSCIMIYYVILWFVKRYWIEQLKEVFAVACVIVLVWYAFEDSSVQFMYRSTYFKWCHYFLFMLLGAMLGLDFVRREDKDNKSVSLAKCSILLVVNVALFYGIQIVGEKLGGIWNHLQIISLIPLLGICHYLYRLCNSRFVLQLYSLPWLHCVVFFIGGLCLEIYLCQYPLFKYIAGWFNFLFPLNIPIGFVVIIGFAYGLHLLSKLWSQTFSDKRYDWKAMLKV